MPVETRSLANAIRALSMDAVQAANSGHPGMPMGMADVATVLWTEYLKFDPADPKWPDRDRFVLSAGHGSMLLYSLLHLTGYARPTIDDIRNFRQLGSPCAGHPENFLLAGVEATTGPLGQGLAMAVGMAIAERHLNADFGDDLVDHRTWVDRRRRLPDGRHQPRGDRARRASRPRAADRAVGRQPHHHRRRDRAFDERGHPGPLPRDGWHAVELRRPRSGRYRAGALDAALADPRPSLVACRTVIGLGAPNKQGTAATPRQPARRRTKSPPRARRWAGLRPPFEIPADMLAAWRAAGARGAADRMRHGRRGSPRIRQRARISQPPDGVAICRGAGDRGPYRSARRRAAEGRDAQGLARWRSTR